MKFAGEQVYAWHLAAAKPLHSRVPKDTAAPPQSFVTRLDLFPHLQCHANVDVAQQVPQRLPHRHHVWRFDLRRVTVECARCKDCFPVFASALFAWASLSRIATAVALFLLLTAVLALGQL
jgi:hypothetical protein